MQLAVLGTDSDVLALVAAAVAAGHEIVWVGDVREADQAAMRRLVPAVSGAMSWEVLLDHATAEAVILGRPVASEELRIEQLKRLVTDALPLLVVHPVVDSVLNYYELDMLRREAGGLVQHYNPLLNHPVLSDMADWVRNGHEVLGAIHQVTCQRSVPAGSPSEILGHLARDVELLATIAGDIQQVSAVGPRSVGDSYASLQVQMTTAVAASLRWSVAPAIGSADGAEIALVGERGVLVLRIADSHGDGAGVWQLETAVGGQHRNNQPVPHDSAGVAIERLAEALREDDRGRRAAHSTWDRATRAMEVVDAVELSLQKGRTIEVHQQQLTEQLAFRGTMAALGCGLLVVGFLIVLGAALLGGVETIVGQKVIEPWPILLLAVLAFFLLLQTIPLLAGRRKPTTPRGGHDDGGPD